MKLSRFTWPMAAEELADDDKPEQDKSDKDPKTKESAGEQVRS
jgi:hypothetical protein